MLSCIPLGLCDIGSRQSTLPQLRLSYPFHFHLLGIAGFSIDIDDFGGIKGILIQYFYRGQVQMRHLHTIMLLDFHPFQTIIKF